MESGNSVPWRTPLIHGSCGHEKALSTLAMDEG
jgi:hypothetical protein